MLQYSSKPVIKIEAMLQICKVFERLNAGKSTIVVVIYNYRKNDTN